MTGGVVFVHCFMGVSRSASIVIAYLMHEMNMEFEGALKHVQERREEVCPNPGFKKQLQKFSKELKDQRTKSDE